MVMRRLMSFLMIARDRMDLSCTKVRLSVLVDRDDFPTMPPLPIDLPQPPS
ncbi:hypothetical protein DOLIC_00160 [Dolichomitus sp. PSUC_FEM 10030005]|nr:hypothetical protein [Dolichomitus sp. PSUC_FEM 10030005]